MKKRQRDPGIQKAIEAAKTATRLANLLGISKATVSGWSRVPADHVLKIEAAFPKKARRWMLRPDLYPKPGPKPEARAS